MNEKLKITNHHQEFRLDVGIDCSSPVLTDQSAKNQCDINLIMESYAKTGMLPHVNNATPRFIDNTLVPGLEAAHNIVKIAQAAFNSLPPYVRKLMDNDPSQLESFIQNPENEEILVKHGLIAKKVIPELPKNTDTVSTGGTDGKNSSAAS